MDIWQISTMGLDVSKQRNSVIDLDIRQISTMCLDVSKPRNSVGDLDIWQISTMSLHLQAEEFCWRLGHLA